ncbi:MAG: recombinase family protein [Rhodobacter sp.]|nr:recombinase family protein [Rhodobacter sp.]
MKIGYIRVSTRKQKSERQIRGMEELCNRLYVEKGSAASENRAVFDEVLSILKKGDTLLVWDMDRAFRSTEDAIVIARQLQARGIEFQAVNFVIDTVTADGNYAYQVNAAAAERERRKISERTIEGLRLARKRGVRLGRPPKLSPRQIDAAMRRIKGGEKVKHVACDLEVHPWTLTRSIRRLEDSVPCETSGPA